MSCFTRSTASMFDTLCAGIFRLRHSVASDEADRLRICEHHLSLYKGHRIFCRNKVVGLLFKTRMTSTVVISFSVEGVSLHKSSPWRSTSSTLAHIGRIPRRRTGSCRDVTALVQSGYFYGCARSVKGLTVSFSSRLSSANTGSSDDSPFSFFGTFFCRWSIIG